MNVVIRKILKKIAPKSYKDGLERCNALGKKLIAGRKIGRFLDVGCGDGTLTSEFAKIAKAEKTYGIEIVDKFIESAHNKGIKCFKFDLTREWKTQSNYFNLILSSQNIEHMSNTRHYLEECYRSLKREGQIIILTENLSSWGNIFSLVFGWQPFSTTIIDGWNIGNPFIYHADEPKDKNFLEKWQKKGISGAVGHVRVLAFTGLKELMEKVGFKKVNLYTRGYAPFWGAFSDFLCSIDKRHGHFLIATGVK